MLVLVKKAGGEYELTDIEPDEISFVDRAANKKKFIVVKRDGGNSGGQEMNLKLTKDEKAAMVKAMQEIKDRVEHIDKSVGEAEEVAEVEKSDRAGIDTLVKALEESLQALKKRDEKNTPPAAKQAMECPKCGWKGEMPDDGKCPKCGATLKQAGGTEKGETEKRFGEIQGQLTTIMEKLSKMGAEPPAEKTPAPPGDAKIADEVKKALDTVTKRLEDIEKAMPDTIGSQQQQGGDGDPAKKVWPSDMARAVAEDEEAERAAKRK